MLEEEVDELSKIRKELEKGLYLSLDEVKVNRFSSFNLATKEDIVRDLGQQKYSVVIGTSSLRIQSVPHGNHCNLDEIFFDFQAFHKLKNDNKREWIVKVGTAEYNRLEQQLLQTILAVNYEISVTRARELAKQILSAAATWASSDFYNDISLLLSKHVLAEMRESKYNCKVREVKPSAILIQLLGDQGNRFLSIVRVDIENKESNRVALSLCFALGQAFNIEKDSMSNIFYESFHTNQSSDMDQCSTLPSQILFDKNQISSFVVAVEPKLSTVGSFKKVFHSMNNCIVQNRKKKSISETIQYAEWNGMKPNKLQSSLLMLGKDSTHGVMETKKVLFEPITAMEMITSVECAGDHMLALTNFGTVYSCGDSSHGQLGHGTLEYCGDLRLISYFLEGDKKIIISQISTGSHILGNHSAAIDTQGKVYTWGKSIICGQLSNGNSRIKSYTTKPHQMSNFKDNALKVSCGSGFTILLASTKDARNGEESESCGNTVYTFGLRTNGRLGQGKFNDENNQGAEKKRSQDTYTCEWKPKIVSTLLGEEIKDISAGKDHSLAVSISGTIWAWGSNTFGQCGVKPLEQSEILIKHFKSMNERFNGIHEPSVVSLHNDLWSPQEVSLQSNTIYPRFVSVSAGSIHSAAICSNGNLYTWGGGGINYCLGQGKGHIKNYCYGFDKKKDLHHKEILETCGYLEVEAWSHPTQILQREAITKVSLGDGTGTALTESGLLYCWGGVSGKENCHLPSIPKGLLCKRVSNMASGTGDQTMIIASEDYQAKQLGSKLYNEVNEAKRPKDHSLDCALIVEGKHLFCHKVIISQRSPVLCEMLQSSTKQGFTNLLISSIEYEIMKMVIEFIYLDDIQNIELCSSSDLYKVYETAKMFKLNRLIVLCSKLLDIPGKVIGGVESESPNISTFSEDMIKAIRNSNFSDVQIKVGGKIIEAHKCFLKYGSEYFASVLTKSQEENTVLELHSESYESVYKMLEFMYSGGLWNESDSDISQGVWIRHLMLLEKYDINGNLSVLHSRIELDLPTAMAIVQHIKCPELRRRSCLYIANHLSEFEEAKDLKNLLKQCDPCITHTILEYIKGNTGIQNSIAEDRKELVVDFMTRAQKSKVLVQKFRSTVNFRESVRIGPISVVLLLYTMTIQSFESIESLLPLGNVLSIAFVIIYLFQHL